MASFTLNGETVSVEASLDTPLLWILRDHLQLMGTKFGCGAGLCGACTVILDGQSTRSCLLPVAAVEGKSVTTIEGLGGDHPVQQAWIEHNVAQCGYCQSGQIMSTVALLDKNASPSDDEIKAALAGNICRCGTYQRIMTATRSVIATATPADTPTAASPVAKAETGDSLLFYNAAQVAGDNQV